MHGEKRESERAREKEKDERIEPGVAQKAIVMPKWFSFPAKPATSLSREDQQRPVPQKQRNHTADRD